MSLLGFQLYLITVGAYIVRGSSPRSAQRMDITMDATGPDLSPLQVTFRTPEEFAAEYDQNLANGVEAR